MDRLKRSPLPTPALRSLWCTDVLEHLADRPAAIAQMPVLKPGGLFLYDTINRSWLSRLLVIGFWEYLARVAPRGTHDWQLFLTPAELHRLLTDHGLQPGAIQGMLPVWWSPWHGWRFRLIRYTGILYLGYAVKPAAPSQGGRRAQASGHWRSVRGAMNRDAVRLAAARGRGVPRRTIVQRGHASQG